MSVEQQIIRAAVKGEAQIVLALGSRSPSLDVLNDSGIAMIAAGRGDAAVLSSLAAIGVDIDLPASQTGLTPIMWAARHERQAAVQVLLENGASVNSNPIIAGTTALHHAAMMGSAAIAVALMDRGADVNARMEFGSTPLMRAATFGHTALVELLLTRGSKLELRDRDGRTAADLARMYEHSDTLDILLKHGAQLSARSPWRCLIDKINARVTMAQHARADAWGRRVQP